MNFRLKFVYFFISLSFYFLLNLFLYSFRLFELTNSLHCSSFSANLTPIFTHYLVLLSLISFLVIQSKTYPFFVLMYYIVNFNFFVNLVNKACCCLPFPML